LVKNKYKKKRNMDLTKPQLFNFMEVKYKYFLNSTKEKREIIKLEIPKNCSNILCVGSYYNNLGSPLLTRTRIP